MATNLISQTSNTGGLSYWGSNARSCQTFTMPSGYDKIEYVTIQIKEGGTFPGNLNVAIYATSGGLPTGSALTSVNLTASDISSSYGNVTANFADITVTAGAKYAIVTSQTATTSISNSIYWGHANSSSYSGGGSYWSANAGSSWTTLSGDWTFAVYGSISVVVPTVTTTTATSVTSVQALLAGNVTDDGGGTVSERGYVISSTDTTPDRNDERTITDGSGTGAFSETVASLTPATFYYWRVYGVNSAGVGYGAVSTFTTSSVAPTVTSGSVSSISSVTATCSGEVTSDGGASVTERGVVWDTATTPIISDNKVSSGTGTGSFSANLISLTANTLIYWRVFATNSIGTTYGTEYTFTTKDIIKYLAQSITTISAGTLNKVSLYLKETLGASSTAKVRIYTDSTNEPGTQVATASITVTGSTYQWYDITFDYDVTATTDYWIVIEDSYVVGSYYQYWGADGSGTYGMVMYKTATGSWTEIADTTATFKVYIQPSLTVDYDISVDYKKRYL